MIRTLVSVVVATLVVETKDEIIESVRSGARKVKRAAKEKLDL